jgi:hypothetical protein
MTGKPASYAGLEHLRPETQEKFPILNKSYSTGLPEIGTRKVAGSRRVLWTFYRSSGEAPHWLGAVLPKVELVAASRAFELVKQSCIERVFTRGKRRGRRPGS